MPVFMVIKLLKFQHPLSSIFYGQEALGRPLRAIFDRFEYRLCKCVVITHPWSTVGRYNSQIHQFGFKGAGGHRCPVVRVQHDRCLDAPFRYHCAINQFTRQFTRFLAMDLPSNNLTTVDVQYQVQIPELPMHPGAQWNKTRGVVELFPRISSPNRTCTFQRIRLSTQQWLTAIATSPYFDVTVLRSSSLR